MVDAIAEIGDQLHLIACLRDHARGDLIGDGRHQHVGFADRLDKFALAHRLVFDIQPRVEQFAHPRLDELGQPPRDDDEGFSLCHTSAPFLAEVRIARTVADSPILRAIVRRFTSR